MSARQKRRRENRRRHHSETNPTRRRLIAATGMTAGATLAMSGVAHATVPVTFTVGSNADTTGAVDCTTPTNTDCTLRQAILDANGNAGADIIVFNSGLSGSTITMTAAPQQITEAVDIQGLGASHLTIDGAASYRDFDISLGTPGDPVSISDMTITNGYTASGNGGAVSNDNADLTISDSVISNSHQSDPTNQGRGGGVFTNTGTLTIDSSTVSGNHAYFGGGIGTMDGTVTVNGSTLTGNYADGNTADFGQDGYGGGINSYSGDLNITSSTIDNNVAAYDGGGIYAHNGNGIAVTITNSTIAANHAANDDAGGVYDNGSGNTLTVVDSTVTGNTAATDGGGLKATTDSNPVLENSIVSGNTSGSDPNTDDLEPSYGQQFDSSFDLIGVPTPSYVNDIVGNVLGGNPRLGPLADNGGPTQTMAPQCGSDAIDQGSAFTLTEDQRGDTRPVGLNDYPDSSAAGADGSDIGAVELQTTPGSVCITESPSGKDFGNQTVGTGSAPQTFTVTGIGPNPVFIGATSLRGTDAAQFSKSSDTCSGTELSKNDSCTVSVSFAPGSTGAKAAQLHLNDNAIDAPQDLGLAGNGVAAPTPTPTPGGGPTGQRAAALNKCKSKHNAALKNKRKHNALTKPVKKNLNKKFKKCKGNANQLPV